MQHASDSQSSNGNAAYDPGSHNPAGYDKHLYSIVPHHNLGDDKHRYSNARYDPAGYDKPRYQWPTPPATGCAAGMTWPRRGLPGSKGGTDLRDSFQGRVQYPIHSFPVSLMAVFPSVSSHASPFPPPTNHQPLALYPRPCKCDSPAVSTSPAQQRWTPAVDPSELTFGSARGARGSKAPLPLSITVVRSLTSTDIGLLANPPPVGSTAPTVQALRASHHQLAQLLARGAAATEASLITGYSISRISILKSDPTFAELLASYQVNRELVFADTLERMRILGLSTLDELQDRLEADPARWSNRELMEMAELMLVKPRIAGPMGQSSALGGTSAGSGGQGSAVTVNVKFVSAATPAFTIDHQPD